MQTPDKLLNNLKTRGDFRAMSESVQLRSEEIQNSVNRLAPLWEAMAGCWSSFVALYGDEPNASWIYELKAYNQEQLMQGYKRAMQAGTEFPPNLSIFISHCRNDTDWEAKRLHKLYAPETLIEDGSKALAAQAGIANLRNIMGIGL